MSLFSTFLLLMFAAGNSKRRGGAGAGGERRKAWRDTCNDVHECDVIFACNNIDYNTLTTRNYKTNVTHLLAAPHWEKIPTKIPHTNPGPQSCLNGGAYIHVAAGLCLCGGGPIHAVFGHFGRGGGGGGGAAVDVGVQ